MCVAKLSRCAYYTPRRKTQDEHERNAKAPPIIKAPTKPTQEEWERHQLTHTPFAPWCQHCMAARNARRNRPKQGRKGRIVPDIEGGEGPSSCFKAKAGMSHHFLQLVQSSLRSASHEELRHRSQRSGPRVRPERPRVNMPGDDVEAPATSTLYAVIALKQT